MRLRPEDLSWTGMWGWEKIVLKMEGSSMYFHVHGSYLVERDGVRVWAGASLKEQSP